MRKIYIADRASYPITAREYAENGFLRVPGRVAKVGIQEYLAGELGLPGDPNRIVRVMRTADEVFAEKSLATYDAADITVEHPGEFVDAGNFKAHSVGVVVGAGRQDGDFVLADLLIKDAKAIELIERGKVQLSAGYKCMYDDAVPEGADYEFIQRDIVINHVALVDRARAGAQARIFDNQRGVKMNRVTLDSGRTVEVADEAVAALLSDTIERLQKRVKDAEAEVEKKEEELKDMEEELEKEKAAKDMAEEELEKAKKEGDEEALKEKMDECMKANADAMAITGGKLSCDSYKPLEIKKAALKMVRPSIDWDSKSDAYIVAAFDMQKESPVNDQYRQVAEDGSRAHQPAVAPRAKAVDSFVNAWKKTAGEV